jgi:hypothetical protein
MNHVELPRISPDCGHERLIRANGALGARLAEPPECQASWARQMARALRRLTLAFEAHRIMAEAPGGPLDQLVGLRPALVPRVERQREEHAGVLVRAARLAREIDEQLALEQISIERLSLEAAIIRDEVRLHTDQDADLMAEALLQVDGGEA